MSFLDAFEGYDKPYRLTLKHPATGEPILDKDGTAAFISIYAPNSLVAQEWKKKRFAEAKKDAKKNNKPELTFDEATAKGAAYYATLTESWYLVNPLTQTGDTEFDFDKAVEIYADRRAGWIVEQLNEALEDASNFLTPEASAKA